MTKTSAKIILDTRKVLSNGRYPIKIVVGFHSAKDGKKNYSYQYYSTGHDLFKAEYEKLYTANALAETRTKVLAQLTKAKSILEKHPFATPGEFELIYTSKGHYESVQGLFELMRTQAKEKGQVSTYYLYRDTKNAITKYSVSQAKERGYSFDGTIAIGQITTDFLHGFEAWMVERGCTYNTIGIYARNIRTMFNFAISKELVQRERYPFGKGKYMTPSERGKNKALNIAQKDLFINFQAEGNMKKYHDFCKLSLFCFGMNFSDIARLKWKNFDWKTIRTYRKKTVSTRVIKEKLDIPVTPEIKEIISRYAVHSLDPEAFIFPILTSGLDPFREKELINAFIHCTNKALLKISEKLNLPKITTYTLRHTFAYIMKKNNVPISKAQGMMGHESSKTTEIYYGSIETDETMEVARLIYGK